MTCLLGVWLAASAVWAETSALEIKYRVRVRGVEERALRNDLRSVSEAVELIKRPPISELQLRRRAERDVPRFQQVLRAHGYYAASVDVQIRTEHVPARIEYVVTEGPRYVLREIDLAPADPDPDSPRPPSPEEAGLVSGEPALARKILQAEERIVQALGRRGYPFARANEREVRVEHAARAVDVIYRYEAGPPAVFGETAFHGLTSVRESFMRGKVPWNPGDPYDGRLLRLAQRRMTGSDLFSSVRVIKAEELTPEGALPLRVEFSERKHRSIGFGAGYASDEGARGRVWWEHRNLMREGERLGLSWSVTEIGYATEARFLKPDFRMVDQALKITLRAALDDPDAFRSRNIGGLVGVERQLQPGLLVGAGVGMKYSSVRDATDKNRFALLYLPVHVDWDRSDDVLDPRRGNRLTVSMAPYRDLAGSEVTFVKGRAGGTQYMSLSERFDVDLAFRLVAATIAGAPRDDVPADERLYAGGGGTVRGYEYQSVGPLDDRNRPVGGKSQTLASSELRWRLNREFGLVAFVDGGAVYEDSVPEIGDDVRWGAGFGIRYFTPVGPLRFDLAFPLNRRSGVDDDYQFYISLGQAF
jgi:translocation and assembly module TamA